MRGPGLADIIGYGGLPELCCIPICTLPAAVLAKVALGSKASLVGNCALSLQPLESQRLYKDGTLLEDARKLADLKIENDDVLALTFNVGGS